MTAQHGNLVGHAFRFLPLRAHHTGRPVDHYSSGRTNERVRWSGPRGASYALDRIDHFSYGHEQCRHVCLSRVSLVSGCGTGRASGRARSREGGNRWSFDDVGITDSLIDRDRGVTIRANKRVVWVERSEPIVFHGGNRGKAMGFAE